MRSALGRVNAAGLATMLALAGWWEAAVRLDVVDFQFLPAPSAVGRSAAGLVASGDLLPEIAHTLLVTLVGWTAASAIGIALGLLLGLVPTVWRYSISSFEVTRAVPPITFVPAALLIFGFSLRMELVIVVYAGVWPVLINTIGGVRGVTPQLLDVARTLRMTRAETVRKIVVPAALPTIVVGLRLALSLCLVLAVVAEMVGNPAGLGNALVRAQRALQPEQMFTYALSAGLLGVLLNAAFVRISSRAFPSTAVSGDDL